MPLPSRDFAIVFQAYPGAENDVKNGQECFQDYLLFKHFGDTRCTVHGDHYHLIVRGSGRDPDGTEHYNVSRTKFYRRIFRWFLVGEIFFDTYTDIHESILAVKEHFTMNTIAFELGRKLMSKMGRRKQDEATVLKSQNKKRARDLKRCQKQAKSA
jgi:hypothetical protein